MIKEKVLKEIIEEHTVSKDDPNWSEIMEQFDEIKPELEKAIDQTLDEVMKVIDELSENVDDGYNPIEKYVHSETLKQKLGDSSKGEGK